MRKLIAGAVVAAALAVPATPAFAIHDPNVPAGSCAHSPSAVGTPGGGANPGSPDLGVSNAMIIEHNPWGDPILNPVPPCIK
jgi:hypothetical protein